MVLSKQWLRRFARSGYFARGVVYLVIGFFALLAAFGQGEEKSPQEALVEILQQPYGTILVWLMVVGLVAYSLWRFAQALKDADDHGSKLRGLLIRAGLLVSGFAYAALALYALSLLGVFGGGSDSGSRPLADAFAAFVGQQAVSLVLGVIFAGVALAHVWKALRRKYAKYFEAPQGCMPLIHVVSILGLLARGAIFAVLAWIMFLRFNSTRSAGGPGTEQALQFIQHLPMGRWWLACIGLGLIAFALYSFIEAKWRRINL